MSFPLNLFSIVQPLGLTGEFFIGLPDEQEVEERVVTLQNGFGPTGEPPTVEDISRMAALLRFVQSAFQEGYFFIFPNLIDDVWPENFDRVLTLCG